MTYLKKDGYIEEPRKMVRPPTTIDVAGLDYLVVPSNFYQVKI